jgi:signal transduction histidine kinase
MSLSASRSGGLWIGTRTGGLNKLEGGRFASYRASEWLADESIRAIHEDGDGSVWIGTRRSGLTRLKDGTLKTITTRNGLFDDCVFRIIDDGSHLWMTSPEGVFRVGKSELNEFADGKTSRVSSISYGTSDGMLSSECNGGQPAGWRSPDGKLWFPTVKGIAMIDPNLAVINHHVPTVVIEGAIIDNQAVEPGKRIELAPGKQRYEFIYTALSLVAPEKVRFKYQLEGYDHGWVEAGTERVASYTHIPPGTYTFKVLASNNDGVWNEAGSSIELYLKPYFYQTYWFYALCAAGVALIGLAVYRLRVSRIKARFSAVLEERNRMAREIHDTLAQGFVGIGLQLQAVDKALTDSPAAVRQHLGLAQSMVSHSLVEARRSIWDLRAQQLETKDLAASLGETAQRMTEGTGVKAEVRVAGEARRLAPQIENNALRIGQECLTNALKHSGAQHIVIDLKFEPDFFGLNVRDDGCGFDTEGVLATADGHFGLLGIRERVEHMGGRLTLKSAPGEGTEIGVSIPLK